MSITSSAVLVELNISVWPAKKLDRRTTDQLTANAAASHDAAQVRKNLFAGTALRSDIEKYAAKIRLYHNKHTLPWADKGSRLLPTKMFLEYKQEMNKMQRVFYRMCDDFFYEYNNLVANAQQALGALYDADDYPELEDVKNKFGFRLAVDPLPESGDFRLDVNHDDLNELKAEYESRYNERINEAMQSAWDRLHEVLSHLSEKLTDDDESDDAPKKRYHDSLVTNSLSLCEVLTKLNVTNDPKLEEARKQLELTMLGANIEVIKEDSVVRGDLKNKVDDILKKFEW